LSDFGDVENGVVECVHLDEETHAVNREHAYAGAYPLLLSMTGMLHLAVCRDAPKRSSR
jgi:hypothetical protein